MEVWCGRVVGVTTVVMVVVCVVVLYSPGALSSPGKELFPYAIDKEWSNNSCLPDREVPGWLSGHFLRQVCGAYGDVNHPDDMFPPMKIRHWFDCMPMVASYEFRGGDILFSNKYYRNHMYKVWEHHNKNFEDSGIAWTTFASPFDYSKYRQWKGNWTERGGYYEGHGGVTFWPLGERVGAWDEQLHGLWLDVPSLTSKGPFTFDDDFVSSRTNSDDMPGGFINSPAHPARDPQDGSLWSVVGHYQMDDTVLGRGHVSQILYRVEPVLDGRTPRREVMGERHVADFDMVLCRGDGNALYQEVDDMLGMLHSFVMTENYVILPSSSYGLNYCGMMVGQAHTVMEAASRKGFFRRYYRWVAHKKGKFEVFDKRKKAFVATIDVGPYFFASHQVNAYEEDGKLIADMVVWEYDIYELLTVKNLMAGTVPQESKVKRFILNTESWSLESDSELVPRGRHMVLEFPGINPRMSQRHYKYAYMVGGLYTDSSYIVKVNVDTQEETVFRAPRRHYPGEPVFVPRPGATEEDDGVLLVGFTHTKYNKGGLYILDAKDMSVMVSAIAPELTTLGLHNTFFPTGYDTPEFILGGASPPHRASHFTLCTALLVMAATWRY